MSSPPKKYDNGKAPVAQGLLAYFPKALLAIADVSKYGAEKYEVPYSEKNWKGIEIERYADAAVRHIIAYCSGELIDPESGRQHLAHAAWSILAVLEDELQYNEALNQSIIRDNLYNEAEKEPDEWNFKPPRG